MAERIRSEIRAYENTIASFERMLSIANEFPPEHSEYWRKAIKDYRRAIAILREELAAL